MTLRQQYAGPRARAIARHPDQPGRRSRSHRPAGISPPHQPGLGAQLPQQPTQPRAGRAPSPRPGWNYASSREPATG
jgi:hypothetical protein